MKSAASTSLSDDGREELRSRVASDPLNLDSPLSDRVNQLIARLRDLPTRELSDVDSATVLSGEAGLEVMHEIDWSTCFAASRSPDEIGRLGDFRVLKLLGHGGMGGVFLAEDMQLGRRVALKIMRPEFASRPGATERFLCEAKAVAAVHDEHIVTIYQVGQATIPGQAQAIPFLAQELLSGETLEQRLKRDGKLSVGEAVSIGRQIALGLAAAHERGLIHRDIKPANVFLQSGRHALRDDSRGKTDAISTQDGVAVNEPQTAIGSHHAERDGYVVKLLDFGLARAVGDTANLTQSGMILGTPAYMAPEQARGETVDARADLFSLGCVLYRMLTGQSAFGGKDVLAILTSLATLTPPLVKSVRDDVPDELSDLIDQLLAKDRGARPVSASDVARRMAALDRPVLETKVDRNAGRPRVAILQIALGLAACVLFGVIVIKLKDKDGKETKITLDVPPGTNLVSVKQTLGDADRSRTPQSLGQSRANQSSDLSSATSATKPSENNQPAPFITLDKLDPKQIPATERIAGQPEELVAVVGEHRLRHWSSVTRIAFHPSGEFFVSSEDRGLGIQVWATKTLENITNVTDAEVWKKISRQQGAKLDFQFTPDGRSLWGGGVEVLVQSDETGLARLQLKREHSIHKVFRYMPMAISPDGKWKVVAGEPAGILEIWDIASPTPRLAKEISFPAKKYSNYLTLSQDGRRLITDSRGSVPSADDKLFLWDVDWAAEGGPAVTPFGEPISGTYGALSADGQRLVTTLPGSWKFKVLSLKQIPPRMEFEGNGNEPFTFSPDGNWLAVGKGDNVELYERESESWIRRQGLASARANLSRMTFSPDGKTLVVGDLSGRLHVWDVAADPPVERFPPPPARGIERLAFSPDGRLLAVQGWDGGTVWHVDGETPRQSKFVEPTSRPHAAPSFSPDSQLVALRGGVWNLALNPPVKCLDRPDTPIRFSSVDRRLVTGRGACDLLSEEWELLPNGELKITKAAGQCKPDRRPARDAQYRGGLNALQFACGRMVVDTDQGNIEVWSLDDDKTPLFSVKSASPPSGYRLSPDGNLLFVWDNGFGTVWNLNNDPPTESRFPLTSEYTRDGCFTTDGQRVLTADQRGVAIYDWRFGREHRRITYPAKTVALALHPDGQHVATANGNGTVYILRLPELAEHRGPTK